jgi:hypothetical protein
MHYFHLIRPHLAKALQATYVSVEIAVVGAIIAWLQLRYAKKRDAALDSRNQWEKIHKAMLEFRFGREVLNTPVDFGLSGSEAALETAHALHMLHGELDRASDSPLVTEISDFLNANSNVVQWRAAAFAPIFDELAQQVARKSQ